MHPPTHHGVRSTSRESGAPSRWLRVRDAARYLRLGVGTLNKLRLSGGGPRYAKLGAVVVYDIADLDAWASERKVGSTSEPVRAA